MPSLMTIDALVGHLRERLTPVCGSSAQVEAEIGLLLEHGLGVSAAQRYAGLAVLSDEAGQQRVLDWLEQRTAQRVPIQYVLGEAEFYGLRLQVSPAVLIPRPETELLVERAIEACQTSLQHRPVCRVLDLGTGSGAIALAIKHLLGEAVEVVALDISEPALAVARANAERLGLPVDFRLSDGFAAVTSERFDVLVSNPPYIDVMEQAEMTPEVLEHEPHLALFPATQARERLYFYRLLATHGPALLTADGAALAELGQAMAEEVSELFQAAGWRGVAVFPDYAGHARIIQARL